MASRHVRWYRPVMAISPNRTFRWNATDYDTSKNRASELDLTWSEYVKELLLWEAETRAFQRSSSPTGTRYGGQETEKARN